MEKKLLPREKLIKEGIKSLDDYELLALLLDTGTKEETVFDLSKRIINEFGFRRLFKMNYDEIIKIKGIKSAKASKLLSCFEVTRRIISDEVNELKLNDAKALFKYIYPEYYLMENEILTVVYVDHNLCVIKKDKFSDNSKDMIKMPIKDIVKNALNIDAYGIFLVHNHPKGSLYPSDSDIKATLNLLNILNDMDIHLFDHLIISRGMYYSFVESGCLKNVNII